jgi:PIN domain nuclease of toxin-antitoxin system
MSEDPDRIPLSVLELIEAAEVRLVSHATVLEVQFKYLKNSKTFPFSLDHLEQAMKEFSCTALPISYADIQKLGQTAFLHADPFDRLLMAQAANGNLRLVTMDEKILRTAERWGAFRAS